MTYMLQGKTNNWTIVVGLEIHCQIKSEAKLFSSASSKFGADPNTNVQLLDLGLPGVLPVLNEYCVEQALKTSLALNGEINKVSQFDRKHYFYPDQPLGYQITQFYKPIMENGYIIINTNNDTTKSIGIDRLHIEQDAGKLIHDYDPYNSLVDLNRAGVGLMEIVTMPDLTSIDEVTACITKLQTILKYLNTCDCNMEKGSMRCDVNISVKEVGATENRTRVEIKNVNSLKFIAQAIEYEAMRQVEVWESGEEVIQETRQFDENSNSTKSMRGKEEAADYRYIKEPDLPLLKLSDKYINKFIVDMIELPDAKYQRFIHDYGLNNYDTNLLVKEKDTADYFELAIRSNNVMRDPKVVATWMINNLFAILNKHNTSIKESKIKPNHLGDLIDILNSGLISNTIAKEVFELVWETGDMPSKIVKDKNLAQISDKKIIEDMVDALISANADKVAQVQNGQDKLIGWFVGQIMKESSGKVNPQILNTILKQKIYQ